MKTITVSIAKSKCFPSFDGILNIKVNALEYSCFSAIYLAAFKKSFLVWK